MRSPRRALCGVWLDLTGLISRCCGEQPGIIEISKLIEYPQSSNQSLSISANIASLCWRDQRLTPNPQGIPSPLLSRLATMSRDSTGSTLSHERQLLGVQQASQRTSQWRTEHALYSVGSEAYVGNCEQARWRETSVVVSLRMMHRVYHGFILVHCNCKRAFPIIPCGAV